MSFRVLFAGPVLAAALLAPAAGFAGGYGCTNCYNAVVTPPSYSPGYGFGPTVGTVTRFVRARWATVSTPVAIPPGRVWRVVRGPGGRLVGCWVSVPGRIAVSRTKMLVRPSAMVETRYGPAFGTVTATFTAHPGSIGWVPANAVAASF